MKMRPRRYNTPVWIRDTNGRHICRAGHGSHSDSPAGLRFLGPPKKHPLSSTLFLFAPPDAVREFRRHNDSHGDRQWLIAGHFSKGLEVAMFVPRPGRTSAMGPQKQCPTRP